jgi:hypothetical protein
MLTFFSSLSLWWTCQKIHGRVYVFAESNNRSGTVSSESEANQADGGDGVVVGAGSKEIWLAKIAQVKWEW